ncbi:hypothetical protein ACFOMD_01725 [Sphingoaurantiacus capsulatus]|uniref:Head-tail adaptor protein n=1 Tax=Sphingoaurantiacus capsulatus TaxID=1771310 RepID=A0ABV7X543_9SPHN
MPADDAIARLFGAALRPIYQAATLHRVTRSRARGGSTTESVVEVPCWARFDGGVEAMQGGAGVAARELRLFVLRASFVGGISSDDRISLGGESYAISWAALDPAGVAYELEVRRA